MDWLEPWYALVDPREGLAGQLAVEISNGHVLWGETVSTIARRCDTDDVLFQLSDGRVAEVHLTWKAAPETDPRWPATAIFNSIEDWRRESMIPTSAEFLSEG